MNATYTKRIASALWITIMFVSVSHVLLAQHSVKKKRIVVDVAHGQKFWNDPASMVGKDSNMVERIQYMNAELVKNATSLNAEVSYLKEKITPTLLSKCNALFIHIPSSLYSADEVRAITQYVQSGGSLFIVMDSDYWSTLQQTNVNDILAPLSLKFGAPSPIEQSGGHSIPGLVTDKRLSIPYHGARLVEGGTPFTFSNETNDNPFGTYTTVKGGGKIITMGDGMVSLYMTSWEGVNDYQCSEFMHDAFAWLLQ